MMWLNLGELVEFLLRLGWLRIAQTIFVAAFKLKQVHYLLSL